MPNPNQLIVAQGFRGHRLMYVRLLAEAAIERNRKPILVLPKGVQNEPEFNLHLSALREQLSIVELENFSLSRIRLLVPEDASYPTVFSEGDSWLRDVITFRGVWPGGANLLLMRKRAQSGSRATRLLKTALKSLLRTVATRRRWVSAYILVSATSLRLGVDEVADPSVSLASSVRAGELRDSWNSRGTPMASWAGIVGGIGPRKNVELVASALARCGSSAGLVLAGSAEVDESIVDEWLEPLKGNGRRVIRATGTIPEEEFDSIIAALDCIVLAHSNEGPSGVLAKAYLTGTPVVAAGANSLRADIMPLGHQAEWVPLDRAQLTAALDRALAKPRGEMRESAGDSFTSRLIGEEVTHS